MALTGFARACSLRSGGIEKIELVEASAIDSATYDSATDTFSSVKLAQGTNMAAYQFDEDGAEYREVHRRTNGSYSVEHHLSLSLGRFDGSSRRAVREIATASECGLVAFVTTIGGDRFMVGYSKELGAERPLRLSSGAGTTGSRPAEGTLREIELSSVDVASAREVGSVE